MQHGNRVNKEGEFVVTSQKSRSQAANIDDAIAKLHEVRTSSSFLYNVLTLVRFQMCTEASEPPKETSQETKDTILRLCVACDMREWSCA